jgi:O6-methylguanine-DNA--protein-cysteine methyltransferase
METIWCWELEVDDLTILLASTEEGALRVNLTLQKGADCQRVLRRQFPQARMVKDRKANARLIRALKHAFEGAGPGHLDLAVSCGPFQQRVLEASLRIPFGKTSTYGQIASEIGRPGGSRAVGQALGRNPLPILFP